MSYVEKLLIALLSILVVSYIGINIIVKLPLFLIGENVVLAAVYAILALLVALRKHTVYPYIIAITGFNSGRVSRTIVSPRGEVGDLALEHIPLLLLVLATMILALYNTVSGKSLSPSTIGAKTA